jgi:hypothetical protein
MRIDVYIHGPTSHIESSLSRIEQLLHTIITKEDAMAGELATLQASVTKIDTVVDSAIALITGIKQALDDAIAAGNPAALTALSTDLGAKADALAAAVAANTPTPPTP